jgi:3-hydroxyacyl-[acyl-carrier-protein] dehydratase
MPPPQILDVQTVDCSRVLYNREQIYAVLPQRFEMSQLDGIVHVDVEQGIVAGYRDVKPEEWWCRGHMPGHPIFPGVLMVETAAQLSAFLQHLLLPLPGATMGFGGIDGAKFRGAVIPPSRILVVNQALERRPRKFVSAAQAFVDGVMVFEGQIAGIQLKL